MKYRVTINGNMIIVEADSERTAKRIAIDDFIDIKIEEATQEDVDWYNAMSGKMGDF